MPPTSSPGTDAPTKVAGDYLTFRVATETYGVPILTVREIVGLRPITPVPQTATFVIGVIDLRGRVVPIVDLHTRFGLPPASPVDESCIIILHVGDSLVGVRVDGVQDARSLSTDDIEPLPPLTRSATSQYLASIAKLDDGVVILLDADKLLSPGEMDALTTALPAATPPPTT